MSSSIFFLCRVSICLESKIDCFSLVLPVGMDYPLFSITQTLLLSRTLNMTMMRDNLIFHFNFLIFVLIISISNILIVSSWLIASLQPSVQSISTLSCLFLWWVDLFLFNIVLYLFFYLIDQHRSIYLSLTKIFIKLITTFYTNSFILKQESLKLLLFVVCNTKLSLQIILHSKLF